MPKATFIHAVKSLLRAGREHTANDMATRLECSERTIRRCIAHLQEVEDWPVESGNFDFVLREPSLAETRITSPEEVAAMAISYETLRKLGSSELATALRAELLAICRQSPDLGNVRWSGLETAVSDRGQAGTLIGDPAVFGELTLAILLRQPAEMDYRRIEETNSFRVRIFPHRWVFRNQCWYLVASDLDRGGPRHYALPRISGTVTLPRAEEFQEPAEDGRHEHAFGIWASGDGDAELIDVCVELNGYWARIARERRWHPSQRIEALASDRVRVRFRLNELVEVKTWTLGFGGAAKIIEPDELRQLVTGEIRQMQENYAD